MLRGIAALLVVLHHFTTVLWTPPRAIEEILNMPAAHFTGRFVNSLHAASDTLSPLLLDFRHWGALGVAIFFLISGFVIPFAVTRTDTKSFLVARFWRLWPAYATGLILVLCALTVTSTLAGRGVPFQPTMIAAHLAFIWDLFSHNSYDAVSWTLTIEVRFYILCALLVPLLQQRDIYGLAFTGALLAAGAALASLWLQSLPYPSWPGFALGRTCCVITFMLIGIVFNFHQRGSITSGQLILSCMWFFGLFASAYYVGPWSYFMENYVVVYGYAVLLFALAYATQHAWRCPRWLDALARISYPLYTLHAVCGYAIINIMVGAGLNPVWAFITALLSVIGLAWAIHHWIEAPAQKYGRRLTRRDQSVQTL